MISVQKSVAHPWQCDVLGHLTTRFYVGMFDDASYHFLHAVFGWTGASDENQGKAWVDARDIIEYHNEVEVGGLVEIHAGLKKLGTKSITVTFEMTNLASKEKAASMEVVYVLFDLKERSALVITDDLREMASKFLIE